MISIPAPLINGCQYDWSSCEFKLNSRIFIGIKELSYSDNLDETMMYGVSPIPIGRTRGVYKAQASCTMFLAYYQNFIEELGPGFKEKVFIASASFSEESLDVIQDTLIGCRIKSGDASLQQGGDAQVRKFDMSLYFILWNGLNSVVNPPAQVPA